MAFAIPTPSPTTLPVTGGDPFPVRRIYCVGRNYAAHAREMGHDPDREPPFFFMKPADALVQNRAVTPFPPETGELHHEIELVVALARGGRDIPEAKALECIFGYGVGLDMTRRDAQGEAKKLGRPWDLSKGFDHSAPCTAIQPVGKVGHIDKGAIWLKVNDKIVQQGDIRDLIWSVPETIAFLSRFIELKPGDLIFTGTPDGVGPVRRGDELVGHVDGLEELVTRIG